MIVCHVTRKGVNHNTCGEFSWKPGFPSYNSGILWSFRYFPQHNYIILHKIATNINVSYIYIYTLIFASITFPHVPRFPFCHCHRIFSFASICYRFPCSIFPDVYSISLPISNMYHLQHVTYQCNIAYITSLIRYKTIPISFPQHISLFPDDYSISFPMSNIYHI